MNILLPVNPPPCDFAMKREHEIIAGEFATSGEVARISSDSGGPPAEAGIKQTIKQFNITERW
jgi:hypothetical protein